MKSKLLLGAALSMIYLLGLAIGQEATAPLTVADDGDVDLPPPPPPPPFHHGPGALMAALDADADGVISAEELANAVNALTELDTSGDGTITRDELLPPRPEGAPPKGPKGGEPGDQIMRMDADGDGVVTLEEFKAPAIEALEAAFSKIDTSGDGQIDADEAAAAPPPPPRHGRGPGGPPPGCGRPGPKGGPKGDAAGGPRGRAGR